MKSSRTHVLGTTCTILRVSDGSRRHTQAFGWTTENIVDDGWIESNTRNESGRELSPKFGVDKAISSWWVED